MRHGRKSCPCISGWELCCRFSRAGFARCGRLPLESPPQLARVTSVEVLVERLLLTRACSRKHVNAFLKLITCFPDLGLVCCKEMNLAQHRLSAVARPWAALAMGMAAFAPA